MGHIIETGSGPVEGIDHEGVLRFAGIPYAAPPTGDRRFRPPEPHPDWSEVRDCSRFGATSIQNQMMMEQMLGGEPEEQSEDCLFLNVFTPALDGAPRPVMVWIHGGAFVMGSGSTPLYNGATFASRGDVVVVTINYRLGALGFLHLADLDADYPSAGNNGLLDQVAALEWVRDNIARFGGDPGNVTIFGESAGGMSVGALLGTPAARGLFHKAIPQSGAAHNVSRAEYASGITERFMGLVGASTMADLLAVSSEAILDAQLKFLVEAFTTTDAQIESGEPVRIPFQPVCDGAVLPDPPIDAIAAGNAAGVPVMIGTCRDEWNLFAFLDAEPIDDDLLLDRLDRITGDGKVAAGIYEQAVPEGDAKARFGASVTDFVFRQPAIRLAEKHAANGDPTFMYLFTWATPAMGGLLGSCHALELPFVWRTTDMPGISMLIGEGPPGHLAEVMQDAWLAFARTGDPSHPGLPAWPVYETEHRATMILDEACSVVDDPEAVRRELWADLL